MQFIRTPRICAAAILLVPGLALPADSASFHDLLRKHVGGSENNLENELRSGIIAVSLPHHRDGEFAVVGAIRIPAPLEFYLERFRDIANFKKGPSVLSVGKFGAGPDAQTLSALTLDQKQTASLNGCRPGKCALKLSKPMMDELRGQRDAGTLNRAFRKVLWAYIGNYLEKGTPAMISYADKYPPASGSTTFLAILSEFNWLRDYVPALATALNAPYLTTDQLEEFLYWSTEDYGLKPVVSVTHVFIYKAVIDDRPWAFIASKQIYADHYLDGSLGLTILASEATDGNNKPWVSIAYFNRSATDGLRGWLGSIQRTIVERRARAALELHLAEIRQQLTNAYRERPQ